jgi:hypothetical protein
MGMSVVPSGYASLLRPHALITRRHHARMPPLILGVGITEPLPARRAAYGRRVGAGHRAKCDALTQPLQVRALVCLFFHGHETPRAAILPPLAGLPEK